jgi:hypothetical protein
MRQRIRLPIWANDTGGKAPIWFQIAGIIYAIELAWPP